MLRLASQETLKGPVNASEVHVPLLANCYAQSGHMLHVEALRRFQSGKIGDPHFAVEGVECQGATSASRHHSANVALLQQELGLALLQVGWVLTETC